MMVVLVDAFNLIYKFPHLEFFMYEDKLDEAKEGLVQILSEVKSRRRNLEFLVFVDGKKVKGDYETYQEEKNGIRLFYSIEREADDLIRGFIQENPRPNTLSLVTSDKKIIQFAKQFKVRCITSESYSKEIQDILDGVRPDNPEEDKPLSSPEEEKEWLEIFTRDQSQSK